MIRASFSRRVTDSEQLVFNDTGYCSTGFLGRWILTIGFFRIRITMVNQEYFRNDIGQKKEVD